MQNLPINGIDKTQITPKLKKMLNKKVETLYDYVSSPTSPKQYSSILSKVSTSRGTHYKLQGRHNTIVPKQEKEHVDHEIHVVPGSEQDAYNTVELDFTFPENEKPSATWSRS